MIVRICRSRKAYFCRKARQCYPNETFAYLIGRQIHNGLIEVHWFYYPELVKSTPQELETTAEAPAEAEKFAKEQDMVVVGDIHTHPDYPPIMSGRDHLDHKKNENKITAILEVPKNGRTKLAVWRNSPLSCDIEYF
jgi:proteasome lid subunit RPN8/RPN11